MANQIIIDIGAAANDGTGDPLRTAFNYVNDNFSNVWNTGLPTSNIQFSNNRILTTLTNANLVLAPNGIGVVQSNVSIIPNINRAHNLGSAVKKWDTLYVWYGQFDNANIANATISGGTISVDVGNLHISGGENGYVLQTDGDGNLSWTAQTGGGGGNGTPGGANTQIQFNDAGSFGGAAGFTFNKVTGNVAIPGNVGIGNAIYSTGLETVTIIDDLTVLGHVNTVGLYLTQADGGLITLGNIVNLNSSDSVQLSSDSQNWTFDNTGNLTLPGNTFSVNYANGDPVSLTNSSNTFSSITLIDSPSGASNTIKYGLGNLVAYLDGQWTLGEYDASTDTYGATGIRVSPGIEGAAEVILPANQDANVIPLQVNNYAGNVQIQTANSHAWIFDGQGNVTLPGDIKAISDVNLSVSQTNNNSWVNTYGNITVDSGDVEGNSCFIDADDNIYVTGTGLNPNFSLPQAYLRKLNNIGTPIWEVALPPDVVVAGNYTSGETVVTDASGNVYWLVNLWNDTAPDSFIVFKIGSNGAQIWNTRVDGAAFGWDITVNSSGQVFVAGADARITALSNTGTWQWTLDAGEAETILDIGTKILLGRSNGVVDAYSYTGTLLWSNQVFNGGAVFMLAWDGTDWYAGTDQRYITKVSGSDNSTVLWRKRIDNQGRGGNSYWMDAPEGSGALYVNFTGSDGVNTGLITVKLDASTGDLTDTGWARILRTSGSTYQWYWWGHHDLSVHNGYYVTTGYGYPNGASSAKQILGRFSIDGTEIGATYGAYGYYNVPDMNIIVGTNIGEGYNGSPAQPDAVAVTTNTTTIPLQAPYGWDNQIDIELLTSTWNYNVEGTLTLPGSGTIINHAATSLDPATPQAATMVLTPDSNYGYQALVLDPTAPGHIHLRSVAVDGGNIDQPFANIFVGGELSSFEVGASYGTVPNVFVHSGGNTWTFATDGNLQLPATGYVTSPLAASGAGGYNVNIQAGASDQGTWNSNPGGNLNLIGGYGSFADGSGGHGGEVNIVGGDSSDNQGGNVNIAGGNGTSGGSVFLNSPTYTPPVNSGEGIGESALITGTRRAIGGYINPTYAYTSVLNGTTSSVVYQSGQYAYSVKVTFAIQSSNLTWGWEQFDVVAVRNFDGGVTFAVSNRVNSNPANGDTAVSASINGGTGAIEIYLQQPGPGTAYVTYDAIEFNQMVD